MWGPGHFSRASAVESVRSVVVLLVCSMVAASGTVVLPLVGVYVSKWGEAHFLACLRVSSARLLLRVRGTLALPAGETGLRTIRA